MYGLNSPASGNITRNIVWSYQKNGIVVRGAKSTIRYNTVIGQGPANLIAQVGIEVGFASGSTIDSNRVFGNSYTGSNQAAGAGVLLFGGPCYGGPAQTNTAVTSNELSGNDTGVSSHNLAADCVSSVTSATRNTIQRNTIRNNGIFNTTGGPLSNPQFPYQAVYQTTERTT